MKRMMFKSLAILAMLCLVNNQMSAQGFLKKLAKGVGQVVSSQSDSSAATSTADTATVKPLKWDKIPQYHAEKRSVTTKEGIALKNDDGTPLVRVFLVDQFGNVRSPEAIKEQHKKLNKAIGNILLKVGGGAALGVASGLLASKGKASGAIVGGAVGAGAGLLLSKDDIKMAKLQKKSLKAQEELIAKYQENFTNEGTPINASVDVTKIDGLEITDGVSMTAETLKAELESESFNSSDDSAWTI